MTQDQILNRALWFLLACMMLLMTFSIGCVFGARKQVSRHPMFFLDTSHYRAIKADSVYIKIE